MSSEFAMRALALGFAPLLIALNAFPGDPSQGLAGFLEQARNAQEADVAAWREFRFERREQQERLDASGRVTETEDFEAVVTPLARGGFDEQLVRHNGREPTPREVQRYHREGRFSKHYSSLRTGVEGKGKDADNLYSLRDLLRMSSYRYAGREVLHGVSCHRLDFSPGPLQNRHGLMERIGKTLEGSVWITESGLHVYRAEARSVDSVSILPPFVSLPELEIRFESEPVGQGVWLPHRITVRSALQVLWKVVHRRTTYTYSGFTPAGAETGLTSRPASPRGTARGAPRGGSSSRPANGVDIGRVLVSRRWSTSHALDLDSRDHPRLSRSFRATGITFSVPVRLPTPSIHFRRPGSLVSRC